MRNKLRSGQVIGKDKTINLLRGLDKPTLWMKTSSERDDVRATIP